MKIAQLTLPAGDVRPGDTLILPDNSHVFVRALDTSNPLLVTFNAGPGAIIRARRTEVTVLRDPESPSTQLAETIHRASLGEVGMRLVAKDRDMQARIGGALLFMCGLACLAGIVIGGLLAWWLL